MRLSGCNRCSCFMFFSFSVCVCLLYYCTSSSYACVEILYITQGKSTNCNDALAKANVLWAMDMRLWSERIFGGGTCYL